MPKRSFQEAHGEGVDTGGRPKRTRYLHPDRLSSLSDELLLRTFSYLPIPDLLCCERLSQRLKSLSSDSQIWKAHYYTRFVLPRASRIPGIRKGEQADEWLRYSSRISKWLNEEKLVRDGTVTDWKRQYKLRHNWSRGAARVSETEVAEQPTIPPLLVRLHEDMLVIADLEHGLRAWSLKQKEQPLAATKLRLDDDAKEQAVAPTAMAIDEKNIGGHKMDAVVGFLDGSWSVYTLNRQKKCFETRYSHPRSTGGGLSAVAHSAPYILTMTTEPRLSLYRFGGDGRTNRISGTLKAPRLLASMTAYTAYPPISLGLRKIDSTITASMAYAMPKFNSRWSVGVQELRFSEDGTVLDSRVASAASKTPHSFHEQSIPAQTRPHRTVPRLPGLSPYETLLNIYATPSTKPASLSYNHPYLLTAHPDNTLTLYMVRSTADSLNVGPGTVLWGHTSSISGAHVGDRGKAVSVSTKGNELRVWELEGRGPSTLSLISKNDHDQASVQVRSEHGEADDGVARIAGLPRGPLSPPNDEVSKGWVAFDEERVVLLREKMHGAQAIVVYDFS